MKTLILKTANSLKSVKFRLLVGIGLILLSSALFAIYKTTGKTTPAINPVSHTAENAKSEQKVAGAATNEGPSAVTEDQNNAQASRGNASTDSQTSGPTGTAGNIVKRPGIKNSNNPTGPAPSFSISPSNITVGAGEFSQLITITSSDGNGMYVTVNDASAFIIRDATFNGSQLITSGTFRLNTIMPDNPGGTYKLRVIASNGNTRSEQFLTVVVTPREKLHLFIDSVSPSFVGTRVSFHVTREGSTGDALKVGVEFLQNQPWPTGAGFSTASMLDLERGYADFTHVPTSGTPVVVKITVFGNSAPVSQTVTLWQ